MNMSQDALADAIGANRVTISQYERGIYLPSVPALERLAEVFGMSTSQLTGGEEPKTDVPKTTEAKIISGAIDKMPKEQREQAESILRAVFKQYFTEEEEKIS